MSENQENPGASSLAAGDQENTASGSGANASLVPSGPLADKTGQDQSVKPKFVATFLSLDVSFVTNLPAPVLQKITARAEEMENLKSQRMLDQVNYDQIVHDSQQQVSTMQQRMDTAVKEAQEVKSKLGQIEQEKHRLEREHSTLKSKASEDSDQVLSVQTRLDNLAQEKRQTLDTLERRNNELRELRNELDQAQKKQLESRKQVAELDNQVQQARASQSSNRLKEQQQTQQIESLKRSNEWYEEELNKKSTEFKKFRSEKLSTISELTSERDSLDTENKSLKTTQESLNKRLDSVNKKYDDSLLKIQDLKNTNASAEESFKAEMAAQQRLCQLWEQSANDAKARVQELEGLLSSERSTNSAEIAKCKSVAEKEKKRAARLEQQLARLEKQFEGHHHTEGLTPVSSGGAPQTPINKNLGNGATPGSGPGPGPGPGSAVFSPSAQIISDIQKGGGSLVQLYSDFQETKTRLDREKYKNETLRREMDNILEEMENHAPVILAEREENKRLEAELADMSCGLEKAHSEVDELKNKLKSAEIKAKDGEREQGLLSQQLRDLSRQVQHLLVQIQMFTDNEAPLNSQEHAALQQLLSGETSESDTDQLISTRLVLFKNIIDMQQQNEHLLKVTRELGQKMEQEEAEAKKKIEELESEAVERAKQAIETLQQDLQRADQKNEALQHERDMFRRMTQNRQQGDNNESTGSDHDKSEQLLKQQAEQANASMREAQQSLEAYKTETKVTIETLNKQISELGATRSDLQLQLTKAQGQYELSNDRFKNLQENMEACKHENAELKKNNSSLQDSLSKQDMRTQQVAQELIDAKSMSASMKSEVDNLKSEKQLKQSIEDRLMKENSELLEEKGKLNNVIANMQTQEGERNIIEKEKREQLSRQVEELQSRAANLQQKLDAESEEVKRVQLRKEHESGEYQQRIDQVGKDLNQARQELTNAKHGQEQAESRLRQAQLENKTAQEKLAIYTARGNDGEKSAEEQLSEQVSTLTGELEKTKHELSMAQTHVKEMTEVASAAEESLQSLTDANNEFQASIDRELESKQNEIEVLQNKLNDTGDLLSSTNQELAGFKEEESKKIKAVEEEKEKLEVRIKELEGSEQNLAEMRDALKKDLEQQSSVVKEAQDSYEKELVKHAEAARTAQELRTELREVKEKSLQVESDYKNAGEKLANSESNWETQKYGFEQQIEQLQMRCGNLADQNRQMLDQLERATCTRSSNDEEQVEAVASDEATVGAAPEGHLRHIVRYLKQEKEIVEVNLELAKQESRRYKQQLDHVSGELDQTRAELESERQREQDSERVANEHEQVLAKLNELNVLRESNSQLRSQTEYYQGRVDELNTRVASLQDQLEPVQEELREARALNETHKQEIEQSGKEIASWKERVANILSKYDRVDPAEMATLKQQVEELKKQVEELTTAKGQLAANLAELQKTKDELETKLKEQMGLTQQAEQKAQQAQQAEEKKASEHEALATEHDALGKRFERLREESQQKLKRRREENNTVKQELEQQKVAVQTATAELERLKEQSGEVSGQVDANLAELQTELANTKAELEQVKASDDNGNKGGEEEAQKVIDELKQQVEKLTAECQELKKSGGGDANVDDAEKASLVEEKAKLEQERQTLTEQIDQLNKQVEELKSGDVPAPTGEGELTTAQHEEKLKELRQQLEEEMAKVKESAEQDQQKQVEEKVKAARDEILAKMREKASTTIKEHKTKIENESKEKIDKLEEELKQAKEAKPEEGAPNSDASSGLKQEDLDKAVAQARKEMDMRIQLLQNKLNKKELQIQQMGTGASAPTAASAAKSGLPQPSNIPAAPAATGTAQQQRSIQIKGQEGKQPGAAAAGGASRLPRGGGNVGRGGGAQRPAFNRPSFHNKGRGGGDASGQKRPANNDQSQGDVKRQKGGSGGGANQ